MSEKNTNYPEYKPLVFKLKTVAGGDSYNELYANGNSQCHLKVFFQKGKLNPDSGSYTIVKLTQSEIDSIEIVKSEALSDNAEIEAAKLPSGWFYDDKVNQAYNQGFLTERSVLDSENKDDIAYTNDSEKSNEVPEAFDRYLRYEGNKQTYEFMLRIRLDDGIWWTSYYRDSSVDFTIDGVVKITPEVSYRLTVTEGSSYSLVKTVDDAFYRTLYSKGHDIDVYYWKLPKGLHILKEAFTPVFDTYPVCYSDERIIKVIEAWNGANNSSGAVPSYYIGAIIRKNITSLTVPQINPKSPHPDNFNITKQSVQNNMRALRYRMDEFGPNNVCFGGIERCPNQMIWKITDDYGSVHKFEFKTDNGNNYVTIVDRNDQSYVTSSDSPSLAVFNNKLYCAYINGNDNIRYITTDNGFTWEVDTKIPYIGISTAPYLAEFSSKNQLYCFHKGGNDHLWCIDMTNHNVNFSLPSYKMGTVKLLTSPTAVEFNNKLYCALQDVDDFRLGFFIHNSPIVGNTNDELQIVSKVLISNSPSLAVFRGRLYCAYRHAYGNDELWVITHNGSDWDDNPVKVPNVGLSNSPSLAVFRDKLYCAHQGASNNSELWVITHNGSTWDKDVRVPHVILTYSPSLAVFRDKLYCAYRKSNGEVWYVWTKNGISWSNEIRVRW